MLLILISGLEGKISDRLEVEPLRFTEPPSADMNRLIKHDETIETHIKDDQNVRYSVTD